MLLVILGATTATPRATPEVLPHGASPPDRRVRPLPSDPAASDPAAREPGERRALPSRRGPDADDAGAARLRAARRRAQGDRAPGAAGLARAARHRRGALRARPGLRLLRVLAAQ